MDRKESQEPKKRVSWGSTDIKYFYPVDERESANTESINVAFESEDATENTLDYNVSNESVSPYFAQGDEREIQRELDKDFDKNLFEMNLASILEEGQDTSNFRDVVDAFESRAVDGKEGFENIENIANADTGGKGRRKSVAQGTATLPDLPYDFVERSEVIGRGSEAPAAETRERETINVEEIINTVDVRRMVGEIKEEMRLNEELAKHGVRFYYQAAVGGTKRDTVSKSAKKPIPGLLRYYKAFAAEKIEHFVEFSSFLEKKMAEEDENIKSQEQFIDFSIFKEDNIGTKLKALRQLCRTKAKIKWYEIRKARELGLNSRITNNKNKLIEEFNALSQRGVEMDEKLAEMRERHRDLEARFHDLKARLDMGGVERPSEHLERMITEQRLVMESCKKELSELAAIDRDTRAEFEDLSHQRRSIEEEIGKLELSIRNKCVGESELDGARKAYENLEAVFDVEMLSVKQDVLRIRIGEYVCGFDVEPGNVILVMGAAISVRDTPERFIYELFIRSVDVKNDRLLDAIKKVVRTNVLTTSFLKDIRRAEERHEVAVSEEDGVLNVRINVLGPGGSSGGVLDFKIKSLSDVTVMLRGTAERDIPEYGFVSHYVDKVMGDLLRPV
jgi:mRNA-degrading endonuclease RelE of RelBE toxin-antitoxin system